MTEMLARSYPACRLEVTDTWLTPLRDLHFKAW